MIEKDMLEIFTYERMGKKKAEYKALWKLSEICVM